MRVSLATAATTSTAVTSRRTPRHRSTAAPQICKSGDVKMDARDEEKSDWVGIRQLILNESAARRLGVLRTCLEELGKRSKFLSLLHQRAISALAEASDPDCQHQVPPTPATCRGKECHQSAHFGWPRADLEFRCQLCQAPDSWLRSASRSASSWSCVPRGSSGGSGSDDSRSTDAHARSDAGFSSSYRGSQDSHARECMCRPSLRMVVPVSSGNL